MAEEKSEWLTIYGVFSSTVSCHIVGHCAVICSGFVVGRFDYLALKLLWPEPDLAWLHVSEQECRPELTHQRVIILLGQQHHGDRSLCGLWGILGAVMALQR